MPSTVSIVSGSVLIANTGFARIGGAEIVTISDIHKCRLQARGLISNRAKDSVSHDRREDSFLAGYGGQDYRQDGYVAGPIGVKDTRISLTILERMLLTGERITLDTHGAEWRPSPWTSFRRSRFRVLGPWSSRRRRRQGEWSRIAWSACEGP